MISVSEATAIVHAAHPIADFVVTEVRENDQCYYVKWDSAAEIEAEARMANGLPYTGFLDGWWPTFVDKATGALADPVKFGSVVDALDYVESMSIVR